jgi:hypothetical protein
VPGGYLLARDVDHYLHPGTRKAYSDFVLRDDAFRLVAHLDHLAVAQKRV